MKKLLIALCLFCLLAGSGFAQDPFYTPPIESKVKVQENPDGPIGSIILTCLGGFHHGTVDLVSAHQEGNTGDLGGYTFLLKAEAPMTRSCTLILSINLDSQSISEQQVTQTISGFTIVGGVKLFILP